METAPSAHGSEVSNPDSGKSEDGNLTQGGGRASPPPNCAICLGTCRNRSFTDSCLHQFCFKCLLTWSKVKAVCPLCKQNFRSIIHNVRSNHQYEEYVVVQRNEGNNDWSDLDGNASRTFIYRTTLTVQPHESIAIQQLLLQHYPMMANVFPGPARRRRSSSLFRRTVYRHNLWARPLPDFTGRFRDCNPDFYRYNQTQMHRLMPWMNRELYYLLNENQRYIDFVMSRILEMLQQYHINSPEFRDALHRYLGERTEHFLHELYCFASTPYDLTGYDRNVQYTTDTRVSTMINELDSGSESSVDSDIIMISSSAPAASPPGPSRLTRTSRVPVYPQNYIPNPSSTDNVIPIETISHSDTDDDSEVMVVGYIKPPQDRTPEIVDLLGSDSDVIVQDTPQPEPPNNPGCSEYRSGPLVKLSLRCHRPRENRESDSDDSSYRPPRPRRKRRARSADTATTVDTNRMTPSPARVSGNESTTSPPSTSSSSSSSSSSSASTSSSSSSSSSTDYYDSNKEKRKAIKRKLKRKRSCERSKKNCKRSKLHSYHMENKDLQRTSDKSSKRKSHSGIGVKSSKKSNGPTSLPNVNIDQPQTNSEPVASTSGTSNFRTLTSEAHKDCQPSQERKRLKSVVRVIRDKKTMEASSNANENLLGNAMENACTSRLSHEGERYFIEPFDDKVASPSHTPPRDSSDSDDNLPLNLTIQKMKSIKFNNARGGLPTQKNK